MWTPPHDWTDGEKVTARLLGLVRDNFKFLYSPPHCRAAGMGTQQLFSPLLTQMIDFQKTIRDTDAMREDITVDDTVQNEPTTGIIGVQTPGKYLAYTCVDFEWSATGAQEVYLSVRATVGAGWGVFGRATPDEINSGGPRNIIPVIGAYLAGAGYQFSVRAVCTADDAGKIVSDFNVLPGFYVHWLGGP